MRKRYILFLILFFFYSLYWIPLSSYGQNTQRQVDSLWNLIKKERKDTSWAWSGLRLVDLILHSQPDTAMWILSRISPVVNKHWKEEKKEWVPLYYETGLRQAEALYRLNQKDSALTRIQILLTEAQKNNHRYYYAYALTKKAWILERSGEIDQAIQFYQATLNFLKNPVTDDEKRIYGKALLNMGTAVGRKGNLHTADSLLNASLKVFSELNDPKYQCSSYNSLAVLYLWKGDFPKAKAIIEEGLKIALKFNLMEEKAIFYANLGNIFYYTGSYDSAAYYMEEAIQTYKLLGKKGTMAKLLLNLGAILDAQGNLYKAIDYHFQALQLFEEMHDSLGISKCYTNIGGYYTTLGDDEKALEYYHKAAFFYEKKGFLRELAITYANIGEILYSKKRIEESKNYFEKSLEISKKLDDKQRIAKNTIQLGFVYLEAGDIKKSIQLFRQALGIAKQINAQPIIAHAYKGLTRAYQTLNQPQLALYYGNKAFQIATSIHHFETIRDISYLLYQLYKQLHNYPKALYFFETFINARDSLTNEINQRNMIRNEYKYQYEKEKAIQEAQHAAELEKQRIIQENQRKRYQSFLLFLGIVLTLSLVFSILLYNRYKIIQKQNEIIQEQKEEIKAQAEKLIIANEELQQQKEEILAQSEQLQALNELLQKQNEELNKKQKDIFDSIMYAKRIQKTILPGPELLHQHFQDYCLLYLPHTIVSGDFYFFKITDDYYYIAVGDCTGHGVPGAMVSLTCHHVLDDLISTNPSIAPGELLTQAREEIVRIFHSSSAEHYADTLRDGMDIALVQLSKENPLLCNFAGAYNPLYIITQNSFEYANAIPFSLEESPSSYCLYEIKGDKQPVGFIENPKPFHTQSFQLPYDTILCLFSDGYPSQFGGQHGKKFGYKNFKRLLLKEIENLTSLRQMENHLHEILLTWQGNYPQIDDITVLCFKPNQLPISKNKTSPQ